MSDDLNNTNIQLVNYDTIPLSSFGIHMIFNEIDEDTSFDTCEFLLKSNLLMERGSEVTIFINSPGGNCNDGWAIVDMMECSHLVVSTRAVGQIMSMGTVIFVAGTKGRRIMTPHTEFMSHQFSDYVGGKAHELMAVRKSHDLLNNCLINHFERHTTMTKKQIKDILFSPSDNYLTPKECLKYGICDIICAPDQLTAMTDVIMNKKKSRKKLSSIKPIKPIKNVVDSDEDYDEFDE